MWCFSVPFPIRIFIFHFLSLLFICQVVSSANYRTGGDVNDFLHGWLNYQVALPA
jgi:hypothetical protein